RAGFDAVAAKDAAVVIDVVDLGVALRRRDADFGGVIGGFNIDAVGRAGRGAQKARHALFQAVFVTLQHVRAAVARLENRSAQGAGTVGVILHLGGRERLTSGDAHALGDGGDVAHDRHAFSIRWRRRKNHEAFAWLHSHLFRDVEFGSVCPAGAESAAAHADGAARTRHDDAGSRAGGAVED